LGDGGRARVGGWMGDAIETHVMSAVGVFSAAVMAPLFALVVATSVA
jgi:hypothetical protein